MKEKHNHSTLMCGYLLALSFASAAIPIGAYYLKFDWLGAGVICIYGLKRLMLNRPINYLALKYAALIIFSLALNGIVAFVATDKFYLISDGTVPGYFSLFSQFAFVLFVFVTISSLRLNAATVYRTLNWWVIIGLFACLLAVIQFVSGNLIIERLFFIPYYSEATISKKIVQGVFAATAWFAEASWFGSFLVVPTTYTFFLMVSEQVTTKRFLFLVTLLAGIMVGYSLIATISVIVGFFCVLVVQGRLGLKALFLLGPFAGVIYLFSGTSLLSLQKARFIELFGNLANFDLGSQALGTTTSFYTRSIGFAKAFTDFLNNPLFGIGVGQSDAPYNSGLLTILGEQGVVGILAYYTPVVILVYYLLKIRKSLVVEIRQLSNCFIALLVADYFNGFVTHHSFHLQRWILISCAFSWIYYLSKSGSVQPDAAKRNRRECS